MFAHIRLATKGEMAYENCHPFVKRDASGRAWTLIHNGTIFECTLLSTVPLCGGAWEPLPFARLLAWRDGTLIFTGEPHGNEYIYDPEDMKYLYLDQAYL